jgi:hypothetical protein
MARANYAHEVKTFAGGTRWLIKWIERALPAVVGGLELKDIFEEGGFHRMPEALGDAIANPDLSGLLWRAALVIYFLSWVGGAESDTEMQSEVYANAPHGGRLTVTDAGAIVSIALGFLALCIFGKTYQGFAGTLTVFWGINIIAWRYMVHVLKPPIHHSYTAYGRAGRYIDMERVRVAERYIDGRWQWWRFAVGAVLIVVMDLLAFFLDLPPGYAHGTIFFFVVFVEAWIWLMRWRAKVALNVLEDLSERYGDKLAASA